MGTTLTGTTPQDTYDSLIKVTNNGPLSSTARYLSDGLGNDSVLALSTARVGIGTTSPATALDVSGDARFGGGSTKLSVYSDSSYSGIFNGATLVANEAIYMGGSEILFVTAGSERIRINSTGHVGIGTSSPTQKLSVVNGSIFTSRTDSSENIIISDGTTNSSIQQVTHLYLNSGGNSATFGDVIFRTKNSYTEMARFTSNGLTFNGDTAAANALDDYEEGTWTMGITFGGASTGVTYIFNTGNYTKIGRQVNVTGWVRLSSKGSSTGTARITGLPFTNGAASQFYTGVTFGYIDFISFADVPNAYVETNATTIFMKQTANAGAMSDLTDANFANNSSLMINATYYV